MQLRKIYLTVLAAVGALAIVACPYFHLAPTSRVEANGVHRTRSVELLPLAQWGFRKVGTSSPKYSFIRKSYGVIAVSEQRWW